jgi:hypothetical protein
MPKAVKDWTKLESYIGLTPAQVIKRMRTCGHMLSFGNDPMAVEVIRTFNSEYGDEAGLAALAAVLFFKKHGSAKTAMAAVRMYEDISQELNDPGLRERVNNMSYCVYYVDHGFAKESDWPVKFPMDEIGNRAGLANVMLGICIKELANGPTTHVLAANGIVIFLEEGMKKRKAKSNAV